MRKQDMKVGETYKTLKEEYGHPAGTPVIYKEDDGTQCVAFTFPSGSNLYLYCDDVEPVSISFDQMMEAFNKHLPRETTHTPLMDGFRAYRSENNYLSIYFGKSIELNLHESNSDNILLDQETQYLCRLALEKLKEYETEQAPVEMTIEEIASKLGMDSSKLRIKE